MRRDLPASSAMETTSQAGVLASPPARDTLIETQFLDELEESWFLRRLRIESVLEYVVMRIS